MKKILSIFAIILLAFVLISCGKSASAGTVEIKIYNLEAEEIFDEKVKFSEEDTLEDLLKEHKKINMKGETLSYGFYITDLAGVSSKNYENCFWNVKVNGEDSMVGISMIKLVDGDVLEFHLISFA